MALMACAYASAVAAQSWLEWMGWQKLVFGFSAHRRWHYTRDQQPSRYVRWYIRSVGAAAPETIMNLCRSLKAFLTCTEPPWTIKAREAAEADEAGAGEGAPEVDNAVGKARVSALYAHAAAADVTLPDEAAGDDPARASGSVRASTRASTTSSAEARELAGYKRWIMATGVVGTFVAWTIFTWCVALLQAAADLRSLTAASAGLRYLQVHLRMCVVLCPSSLVPA
jgi:hypothetical protein